MSIHLRDLGLRNMTLSIGGGDFPRTTIRVRESGARLPDAKLRDRAFFETLRHLSRTVNGWRRPRVQHARRMGRGGCREQ